MGASRVPTEIISMFENGKLVGMMDLQVAMLNALEAVEIAFSFMIERGEFLPTAVTYSPPDRQHGH